MCGQKHGGLLWDCVCLVRMRLSLGVADVAVLDAQHHVGAGAAAGALLEQAAALQRRRHAGQRLVAPRLAEAVDVLLPCAGRPVPNHLLWPGVTQKGCLLCIALFSEYLETFLRCLWLTMCCH